MVTGLAPRTDADTEAGLVEAVRRCDPGAREVYADYLEAAGRTDRAALLRSGDPTAELLRLMGWLSALGVVGESPYFRCGSEVSVGIGSMGIEIGPGAEAQMTWRPQVRPFLPSCLVVPDETAPHFDLLDVKVGNRSQLLSGSPIPCSMLRAGVPVPIRFEVCWTAQDLVLSVLNRSDRPREFIALACGREGDGADAWGPSRSSLVTRCAPWSTPVAR